MNRNRTKPPEPQDAEPPEDQADEFEAIPADLAAAAAQFSQQADVHRQLASTARAKADTIESDAGKEAARIVAEARQAAQELGRGAASAERVADQLQERARNVTYAVAEQLQAEQAEQLAADLASERAGLAEQDAEMAAKLAALTADRKRLDEQLAAARQDTDLNAARAAVTSLRAQIATDDDLKASLTGQQTTVRARLAAIGDGTARMPGELLKARNVAAAHRGRAADAVNRAWPNSAQARLATASAELAGALAGNLERLADQRREARKPQPPRVVRL